MITLTPSALSYIEEKKASSITLEIALAGGCCGAAIRSASVRLGTPHKENTHKKVSVQGIDVYVPLFVRDEDLTIDLDKFLVIPYLRLDGVEALL